MLIKNLDKTGTQTLYLFSGSKEDTDFEINKSQFFDFMIFWKIVTSFLKSNNRRNPYKSLLKVELKLDSTNVLIFHFHSQIFLG